MRVIHVEEEIREIEKGIQRSYGRNAATVGGNVSDLHDLHQRIAQRKNKKKLCLILLWISWIVKIK